jgi:hypothetical protein
MDGDDQPLLDKGKLSTSRADQGRCVKPIATPALRRAQPAARSRVIEFLTQGLMGPDEMVRGAPPFEVECEFSRQVGDTP